MASQTAIEIDCEIPVRETRLSPWGELLWPAEWAQLRLSRVYQAAEIPHGNGEPVIVVPGFLGSDLNTGEMRRWLARAGYAAHSSGIGSNADCPDVALEKLEERLKAVATSSGRRVSVVGHSLGGLLARAAAVRHPDLVKNVITLGSPLRGVRAQPLVLWVARLLGGMTPPPSASPRRHGDHVHDGSCACELVEALTQPFPGTVARTSIYSQRDGIVDWRSCVDVRPGRNVSVNASHLGMLANKEVYEAVAAALAGTLAQRRGVVAEAAARRPVRRGTYEDEPERPWQKYNTKRISVAIEEVTHVHFLRL